MFKILVINPNSSKSVTENLESILATPPNTELTFYTAPPNAPAEISDHLTSDLSAEACFPDFLDTYSVSKFDGFLVCCYSDHPLIYKLRQITKKPVLGIFQASLTYALTQSPSRFGILTSTESWESILDEATREFFGGSSVNLFAGTVASNVEVLQLSDPVYFNTLISRAQDLRRRGCDVILLGCAGLSGMEAKLQEHVSGAKFIDSVKIGIELLNALIRFEQAE